MSWLPLSSLFKMCGMVTNIMSGSNRPKSPLEAAIGVAGEPATEAFSLLANETRIAILLALWDAYDPYAVENSVPYRRSSTGWGCATAVGSITISAN